MFGVPALILALYDASDILPLHTGNAVVLVPLAIGGLIAALVAALLPGRRRTGKVRRFSVALAAVLAMLVILASAGTLVTPGA
jgi:Flp pilus assembly protein TadB